VKCFDVGMYILGKTMFILKSAGLKNVCIILNFICLCIDDIHILYDA